MRRTLTINLMRLTAMLMVAAVLNGCGGGSPGNPAPDPVNPVNPDKPDKPDKPDTPDNPSAKKYCKPGDNWKTVWVFNKDSDGISFYLDTNLEPADFTVSSTEKWCTAKVEATGTATLKTLVMLVEEYDPRDENGWYKFDPPRTATVHIKSGELFDKQITIAQNCMVSINTSLGDKSLKISAGGESVEVAVFTNCYSWTPTTQTNWLTVKRKDNSTLIVTSKRRPDTQTTARQGTVLLTNDADAGSSLTITVVETDPTISGEDYPYGEHSDWE